MPFKWLDMPNAGQVGLEVDKPDLEAPIQSWTSGRNVRFADNEVLSFPGHDLGTENPSLKAIWSLDPVSDENNHYWVQCGPSNPGDAPTFYAFEGTTHTVLGVFGAGSINDIITSAFLNQNLILNNGASDPQSWDLNIAGNFGLLTGWPVGDRLKALTAHKGFLIGCNAVDAGVAYPYRVRWSDEAVAGGLPPSWTPTVNNKAGFFDLGDTTAALQTLKPMRDEVMVYSEREIYGMQFIGGELVFGFRNVSREAGAISVRAVAAFKGSHVVLTDQDVVITDGQSVRSIIDQRNRRFLFQQLDKDEFGLSFIQVHRLLNEIWVCFPTQGFGYCDLALVWNWSENTWGVRDLPAGCTAAGDGIDVVGFARRVWEDEPAGNTWDLDDQKWDQRSFNLTGGLLLLGGDNTALDSAGDPYTGGPIYRTERTHQFDGTNKRSRIERLGIRLNNGELVSHITEVWPRALGSPFDVWVGSQEVPNGAVTWQSVTPFDPEVSRKVTLRTSGRYPCLAFESNGNVSWALQGVSLRYREGARR